MFKRSFHMAASPSRSAFSSKFLLMAVKSLSGLSQGSLRALSGLSQGSLQGFCRTFGNFVQAKPMFILECWYPFCLQFYPNVRVLKGAHQLPQPAQLRRGPAVVVLLPLLLRHLSEGRCRGGVSAMCLAPGARFSLGCGWLRLPLPDTFRRPVPLLHGSEQPLQHEK